MKIIKKLLIINLLFLAFNSFADPFDAFKEIAKELDKSVNQNQDNKNLPKEQPQTKSADKDDPFARNQAQERSLLRNLKNAISIP
jgi:hypothetical protein